MSDYLKHWSVLLVLALGYGFAVLNMKVLMPAFTAQATGVREITRVIDTNFAQYNKGIQERLLVLDKRLSVLEKASAKQPNK